MLKRLSIRNIVIIETLDLDFETGLTVITGESGSGKSILLDSIALAFGAKISPKELLRSGSPRGQVELLFDVGHWQKDDVFQRYLLDQGVSLQPDETEILLSRELTQGGSRSRINGIPVSREVLETLRPWVVDLHGQHELTSLFRTDRQRACLDGYGGASVAELKRAVSSAYQQWRSVQRELEALLANQRERLQHRDFLMFQSDELVSADLKSPTEDEDLRQELSLLSHAEKRQHLAVRANLLLEEGIGVGVEMAASPALLDQMADLEKLLSEATGYDPGLESLLTQAEGAHAELKAVSSELSRYADRVDQSPERLSELTDRLDALEKLKRKYGPNLSDVLTTRDRVETELSSLETAEEDARHLEETLRQRESMLIELSTQLSQVRQVVAVSLQGAILKELKDLAMPGVAFDVAFAPTGFSPDGTDEVTFLFSANPGEPLRPLAKVASGGELSRFLLALKVLTAANDGLLTLIFDEIDSGVSGPTAKALSEKLATLAQHFQVLAITHQPVLAAMGRQHLHVEKKVYTNSTGLESVHVDVRTLDPQSDERLGVLSRLASGMATPDRAIEKFSRRLRDEAEAYYQGLSTKRQSPSRVASL